VDLFNFFKTITVLITSLATSLSLTFGEISNYEPITPDDSANHFTYENTTVAPVEPRKLDTQSIVGILCTFSNINPDSNDFKKKKYQRGSGVIINFDGFILSNRNVVDPGFYKPEDWEEYQLEGCLAGPAPKEYKAPSEEEIRAISPFIQVPVLTYVVEPVFAPFETLISDYENDWLDFALFLVTDLNIDAKSFGITSLPKKFPYTPILISEVPVKKQKILSYGYPTGTTIGLLATINTIFIQGLISHITDLWTGDQRFQDELFLIQSKLDSEGTAEGGRFGSPIFWKGYVVGIHIYKEDQSLNIYNLGMQPILDVLESNGISMFDEIY